MQRELRPLLPSYVFTLLPLPSLKRKQRSIGELELASDNCNTASLAMLVGYSPASLLFIQGKQDAKNVFTSQIIDTCLFSL